MTSAVAQRFLADQKLPDDAPRPFQTAAELETDAAAVDAALHADALARAERLASGALNQSQTTAQRMTALERSVEKMAEAVATLASMSARAKPANDLSSLDGVLSIVRALKDVAQPAPAASGMMEAISMMGAFMNLRNDIVESVTPPPVVTPDNAMASMLPALIGPLTKLIDKQSERESQPRARRMVAQPAQPPRALAAPIAPAPPPPEPETMNAPDPSALPAVDAAISALMDGIPIYARHMITDAAAKQSDPALWADIVLDVVPDEALQSMHSALSSASALKDLLALVPAWIPYKKWIKDLIDAIRDRLVSELDITEETELPGGAANGDDGTEENTDASGGA